MILILKIYYFIRLGRTLKIKIMYTRNNKIEIRHFYCILALKL